MKVLLISLLFLSPLAASSQDLNYTFSEGSECFKRIYKEEYIPGNYLKPGYVQSWEEDIVISCHKNKIYAQAEIKKNNSTFKQKKCNETLGALAGGGVAASFSAVDAYGWSIPLGLVLGKGLAKRNC